MKTAKTILALALAMIAFLPACKKVDYTKNSSNILIAQFKTAEEYLGMDANTVASNLKSAGWEQVSNDWFNKYSGDCFLTIMLEYDSKDEVSMVTFGVAPADNSENGKEAFSDTDYSDFLQMLGKTPTIGKNSIQCNFSYANYVNETGEEDVDYESYDEYSKNLSKLVNAYRSLVIWEGTVETGIRIERVRTGTEGYLKCTMGLAG